MGAWANGRRGVWASRQMGAGQRFPLPMYERSEDRGRGQGWGFRAGMRAKGVYGGMGVWANGRRGVWASCRRGEGAKIPPPNVRAERGQGEGTGVGVPGGRAGVRASGHSGERAFGRAGIRANGQMGEGAKSPPSQCPSGARTGGGDRGGGSGRTSGRVGKSFLCDL